jgi:hypothetical protein
VDVGRSTAQQETASMRLDGVSPALRQCRGAIVTITALHV